MVSDKNKTESINMSNTALIIVDIQHGFVNEHGAALPARVEALQKQYNHIAACRFFNPENSPFRSLMGWHKMPMGSADAELAFTPDAHCFVYDKPEYTALTVELMDWLETNDIGRVHVCGINTEVCVLHTATDLFLEGFDVFVLKDLCASARGDAYHEGGLLAIRHCIGDDRLITTTEIGE
jgi:nicotinamidase-related amidase